MALHYTQELLRNQQEISEYNFEQEKKLEAQNFYIVAILTKLGDSTDELKLRKILLDLEAFYHKKLNYPKYYRLNSLIHYLEEEQNNLANIFKDVTKLIDDSMSQAWLLVNNYRENYYDIKADENLKEINKDIEENIKKLGKIIKIYDNTQSIDIFKEFHLLLDQIDIKLQKLNILVNNYRENYYDLKVDENLKEITNLIGEIFSCLVKNLQSQYNKFLELVEVNSENNRLNFFEEKLIELDEALADCLSEWAKALEIGFKKAQGNLEQDLKEREISECNFEQGKKLEYKIRLLKEEQNNLALNLTDIIKVIDNKSWAVKEEQIRIARE